MNKSDRGFTLAELLIVAAIIGVLVGVSIPIFTSRLKKARVAVNQANARAGEAAACAEYLDDPSYPIIAYDIRSGKVAKTKGESETQIVTDLKINAYNPDYNKLPLDISSWNADTKLEKNENYKLGDYYFYRYIYTFKDGSIIKIQANDNYKSSNVKDPY